MKIMLKVLVLSFFGMLAISPLSVYAKEKFKSEVVMKTGDKVHLFHSGTEAVKKVFCLNDIIPVYREVATGYKPVKEAEQVKTLKEVGKIKVLSYVGDHYFEAQVVEGSVKVGDVAKKEGAYCLVQPAK
jgi:hypothetical protein